MLNGAPTRLRTKPWEFFGHETFNRSLSKPE